MILDNYDCDRMLELASKADDGLTEAERHELYGFGRCVYDHYVSIRSIMSPNKCHMLSLAALRVVIDYDRVKKYINLSDEQIDFVLTNITKFIEIR